MKFIYIAGFLVIAGLIWGIWMYNRPVKDLNSHNADFITTASDLQKEFTVDETYAGNKYTGKTIELTGKVTSINMEADKVVSILLETSDESSSVICTFRKSFDPKDMDTMKPVRVKGELSGFLMDVLLNNCVLVK